MLLLPSPGLGGTMLDQTAIPSVPFELLQDLSWNARARDKIIFSRFYFTASRSITSLLMCAEHLKEEEEFD